MTCPGRTNVCRVIPEHSTAWARAGTCNFHSDDSVSNSSAIVSLPHMHTHICELCRLVDETFQCLGPAIILHAVENDTRNGHHAGKGLVLGFMKYQKDQMIIVFESLNRRDEPEHEA